MNSRDALNPLRCLKSAWGLTTRSPLALWGAGLFIAIVGAIPSLFDMFGVAPSIVSMGDPNLSGFDPFATLLYSYWMGSLSVVALFVGVVLAWLRLGYYRGVRVAMRKDSLEPGEMYETGGRWWPFYLTTLLGGGLTILAAVPPYLMNQVGIVSSGAGDPGSGVTQLFAVAGQVVYFPVWVYILLGLSWMWQASALEELGPVDALKRSWTLARGNRLRLFLLALLSLLLGVVGVFACLLGIVPAIILVEIMWVESFVQITGGPASGAGSSAVIPPIDGDAE